MDLEPEQRSELLLTEHVRWYRNPEWIKSIAMVAAAMAFVAIAILSFQTRGKATSADNKASTAIANQTISRDLLSKIANNQAGIDELVKFVHDIEAQQQAQGNGSSRHHYASLFRSRPSASPCLCRTGLHRWRGVT
jgi:hypothetical protein